MENTSVIRFSCALEIKTANKMETTGENKQEFLIVLANSMQERAQSAGWFVEQSK